MSMHLPAELQYFCPKAGHAQVAFPQLSVGEHAWPHVPQLAVSPVRFTQAFAESHHVWPEGQPHTPKLHVSVGRHAWPHAPQFFVSVDRAAHSWPQGLDGLAHWH
jgi:hypothetical protein